jgi:phosphoribosylglycinamide formyltransferase 1
MDTVNIALFASGGGSNAKAIIAYFAQHESIKVTHVFCNRSQAGVFNIAKEANVNTTYLPKEAFQNQEATLTLLRTHQIDLIVLAGFLLKVPTWLVDAYPNKILNIHPALLPKHGGLGMYGINVHKAVFNAKETETGITVHLVNENYDDGAHLFSASCPVLPTDSPEIIAKNVLALEHEHYPKVIEYYIDNFLLD